MDVVGSGSPTVLLIDILRPLGLVIAFHRVNVRDSVLSKWPLYNQNVIVLSY